MSAIAIVNGKLVDPAAPSVSVFDAAVMHGDAYFETLRTYDGRPALLGAHLDRLAASVESAGFVNAPPKEILEEEVAEAINEFSEGDVVVRVAVSRGVREIGMPTEPERSTRIVTARLIDDDRAGKDARVSTAEAPGYSYPRKSSNYQLQSGLLREARAKELDEVLIADGGELIEGATSNVFVIAGNDLVTPALGRCLPGVTRQAMLDLAEGVGMIPVQRRVSTDELRVVDEVFITNSLIEARRVTAIDGQEVGGRAIETVEVLRKALLKRYHGVAH